MKNILIIGAGPAGITAGLELTRRLPGAHVTVLEESGAIGGISRTVCHNGNRMDIGGHRFFSKDRRVTDWWNDILPMQGAPSGDDRLLGRNVPLQKGGPDPEVTDRVMLSRTRVSRIFYNKKFFDYPIRMSADTIRNMGLATMISAGTSYIKSAVHKLPETSLEAFYVNRFGRKLYSMFFESYTEKVWGRHPSAISADWGSQRVKGLSVRALLRDMARKAFRKGEADQTKVETSLIERFSYPKYGPGQLWERAAELMRENGGEIIFHTRATGIATEGDRVTGVYAMRDGEKLFFPADDVISTMPVKDLIAGMENVPGDVARVAAGLPYRDFVTVGVLVDKLALKNGTDIKTVGDIVPDCWIYVQDAGVRLGRIQIFNNWSPYMVKDGIWLGLEYFTNEGSDEWKMDDGAWARRAGEELVRMGAIDSGTALRDTHVERVKKAYPAYFDTYQDFGIVRDYLEKFPDLFCIGRNGQHRYNNMDHSMLTAFAAVDCLTRGGDKRKIWEVNTDKEYHEEK